MTAPAENPQPPLIACVDDSRMMRYLLQTTIEAANYRFISFSNPQQAISQLPDCQPDLLLLDLIMPELDGYEVCRQLREIPSFRQLPIVILTSNDGLLDRLKARLAGGSDFLSKSAPPGVVLKVIRKHLKTQPPPGENKADWTELLPSGRNPVSPHSTSEIRYRGRAID